MWCMMRMCNIAVNVTSYTWVFKRLPTHPLVPHDICVCATPCWTSGTFGWQVLHSTGFPSIICIGWESARDACDKKTQKIPCILSRWDMETIEWPPAPTPAPGVGESFKTTPAPGGAGGNFFLRLGPQGPTFGVENFSTLRRKQRKPSPSWGWLGWNLNTLDFATER